MKADFDMLEQLLKRFNESNIANKAEKAEDNIFEIAGYPHYENVVSNILSFFFDTTEQHGYKDLYIKSLLNCYLAKSGRDDISSESIITSNIEREYSNGSDKRIDLLIDCGSFLVLVENKIYASLYNDLDIYTNMANNYLKSTDNEGVPILKIVLSLFEVNDIKQADVINVTYDELIKELCKNKSNYPVSGKWKMFSDEFMENIKRRKATMKMNDEWIEFAENNIDDVSNFIDAYNEDCRKRLDFCKQLCKAVKELDDSLNCGTYSGGKNDPYYSVYLNMKLSDETTVCLETYIMKKPSKKEYEEYSKVYMALWSRVRRSYDYLNRLVKLIDVKDAKQYKSDGWKEQYILQILSLENIDINKLAEDTVKYAQTIRKE